jgi:hypothetical protein
MLFASIAEEDWTPGYQFPLNHNHHLIKSGKESGKTISWLQ